jgi:hypothetical protein
MRKIYAIAALLFLSMGVANAQYYVIPNPNAGTNPGGVNVETEYPIGGGLSSAWNPISGSGPTPKWSTTETLPFTFNFNGAGYTQFKVSTSGVLTFTTSATTVPAFGAVALPNANVPNNSVCILGIRGSGANDSIVTATFGAAPNRQFWVMFASYSTPTAGAYTYWSIALEETSNNIYIVDQRNSAALNVSLGVQINSTTAISVAGSPSVASLAGTDATPIDNSFYTFIYGTQAVNQARLSTVAADPYIIIPGVSTVTGTIQNLGSATITTADIKYEVGGTTYTTALSGLSVASGTSYSFTHGTPVNVTAPILYPVKVWVELAGDADPSDDTLSTSVSGLAFQTTKRVLIEEATGTWCGWCPRGAVFTEQIDTVYAGSAIVVAVHNADPMANAIYDGGMGALIGGYPSGAVDRKSNDVDPTNFNSVYNQRINDVSPADVAVSASFNASTRLVEVTVSATFAADLIGDFRLNAILVEDNVTGTASNYGQTNYYSSTSNNIPLTGAGHNWQTSPNPVPAALMEYDFVGREILGGFDGQSGSIPTSISANSTYSYTFTTTIPSTWDENEMRVIGTVNDAATGYILNTNRGAYGITTQVKEITVENFSMSLYPNPANQSSQLEVNLKQSTAYSVEIFDVLGKSTYSQRFNGGLGKNVISLPLSGLTNGVYLVRVNVNGSIVTTRLVKN